MEQAPRDTSDKSANSKFTFDPTNKIFGVIDDFGDAKAALRDLSAAGFSADEIEIVMGEKEAQRIDVLVRGMKRQFISFPQHRNRQLTMTLL